MLISREGPTFKILNDFRIQDFNEFGGDLYVYDNFFFFFLYG